MEVVFECFDLLWILLKMLQKLYGVFWVFRGSLTKEWCGGLLLNVLSFRTAKPWKNPNAPKLKRLEESNEARFSSSDEVTPKFEDLFTTTTAKATETTTIPTTTTTTRATTTSRVSKFIEWSLEPSPYASRLENMDECSDHVAGLSDSNSFRRISH